MRSRILKLLFAPAVIVAAACGKNDDAVALDAGLSNDLALAAQVQPYQPQQFVSPMEQGYGPQYGYGQYPQYPVQQYPAAARYPQYPQQAPVYAGPAPVRRVPTASRSTGTASTGARASSGTIYRAPAPAPAPSQPMIRHTKRDAAIGAVAGAAIGVVTSAKKDRLKGGLIGAVAGAAAGAIIGNNVDVKRPR